MNDPIAYERCRAAIEQHLNFAIDDHWESCFFTSNTESNALATFVSSYYEREEVHEHEILGALRHGPFWHIYQFGRQGSGKTSIASRCLMEFAPEVDFAVLRVDFKHHPFQPPSDSASAQQQIEHTLRSMNDKIKTAILSFIDGGAGVPRRSKIELLIHLVKNVPPQAAQIPEVVDARSRLLTEYELELMSRKEELSQVPFEMWLERALRSSLPVVTTILQDLAARASVPCLIASVVGGMKGQAGRFIIHIDNVEGLADLRLFPATREALRLLPNELGNYCQCIISLRPTSASERLLLMALRPNPNAYKRHVFSLEGPLDFHEGSPESAASWDQICQLAFEPNAFTTQGLDLESRRSRCGRDEAIIRRRFEHAIAEVQAIMEEHGIRDEAEGILSVLEAVLASSAYREHISGLANFDVRNMLMWASNFTIEISYHSPQISHAIHDYYRLHDANNKTESERQESGRRSETLLDHMFYMFLTSLDTSGNPRTYDYRLYDPAKWALGFASGRLGRDALSEHLVLSACYNMLETSSERKQRVSVSAVVERCEMVGLSPDLVKRVLTGFSLGELHTFGYIEIFASLVSQSSADLSPGDAITVLPRGRELLEALGRKYSFLTGCLITGRKSVHSSADLLPMQRLSKSEFYEVIGGLCAIAEAEYDVVRVRARELIGKEFPENHADLTIIGHFVGSYIKYFGVPRARAAERPRDRRLLAVAMMDHVIGWLGDQQSHVGSLISLEDVDILREMRKEYEVAINALVDGDIDRSSRSLAKGKRWLYRAVPWEKLK